MKTTANYILKAVIDGEVFIFQYDEAPEVWEALEEFWHEDYPEVPTDKSGLFPIEVMAMERSKVIRKYEFMFNASLFHAFFDHGHNADGAYTLNQFANDIETNNYLEDRLQWVKAAGNDAELKAVIDRIYSEGFEDGANADNEKQNPKQLADIMDRWTGFCYNHPRYEEVILWMVGGSKKHYLYQHFCSKFSRLCDVCHNDTMGAWMKFYRTLDSEWAERLMQYVYYEWKK